MAGFTCPYCGMTMALDNQTVSNVSVSFQGKGVAYSTSDGPVYNHSAILMKFYNCPNCGEFTIFAKGVGDAVTDVDMNIRPISAAKQYPDYIPEQILEDYEEACAVLYLSPKASATLSRRCLQGMIRDYWGISKNTLNAEIIALKEKVPADLWSVIDGLRQLGNIGAHMEKDTNLIVDIDPDEAKKLIKLIELLMKEWYISREERKQLFGDILEINAEKQAIRKGEG